MDVSQLVLFLAGTLFFYECEARGSCLEAKLCCKGRDSSCAVYSSANSVLLEPGERPCYCDHACVKVGDCCDDFQYACGASPCEVSDWGPWSECSAACGTGVMTRERGVIRPASNGGDPCPELLQKRSCYGTRCDKTTSHVKAHQETAMVLPATYSNIRHINETNDIRRNLRIMYGEDRAEERSKEYCVMFEVTKVTRACKATDDEVSSKLAKGQSICVRCEAEAMRKHLSFRCQGHGVEHKTTRFAFLAAPQCHGRWQRKHINDRCDCHPDGTADYIFV